MNTSNNDLKTILLEKFESVKKFVSKNIRIVLPIAVAVVALIVFIIAFKANSSKQVQEETVVEEPEVEAVETEIEVPQVALEEGTHPDVEALMEKYYKALADGDMDTITEINNNIDETEKLRIEETAKYISEYASIKVYTKVGLEDGTYLAYVYSEVKFEDYDKNVPGMQAYFICTDDDGNLYINDGEESDTVRNYIREVSLQDDVVDLNNEVAVAYNDMLDSDENLSVFLADLTSEIDTSVGEILAQSEETETEEAEAEDETTDDGSGITSEEVTTVKATTNVNIRSSDSETADKVGKALEGDEFKLIEERGNGWSEVEYEGGSAFIKTEYLEAVGTETVVTVAGDDDDDEEETAAATDDSKDKKTDDDTADDTADDADSAKVSGTVMAKDNVRVRASASEDGEKLGTVYMGQKLDMIEKMSNGWTKVKYNGKIGYVKSEYVE